MAILNDYNQIIREHFDISDTKTRKFLVALENDQQTQLLAALSSALYDKIMQKVDDIDFGSIPRSRGDITKVDGFENTVECLNIMRQLVMEYHENPQIVDTVITAIENVKSRKAIFMKGFAINANFTTVLYNLTVYAIEQCVSFLIAVCIQYIKDPSTQDINKALDKVAYNDTRNNHLYKQLYDFNQACIGSTMNDTLIAINKNGGKITECDQSITWGETPDLPGGMKVIVIKPEGDTPVAGEEPVDPPMDKMPQADEQLPIHGSVDVDNSVPEPVEEISVVGGIGIAAAATLFGLKGLRFILKILIPTMRNITYYLISTKIKIGDAISVQADFIQANAYKLQYSTTSDLSDEKKKKVVERQLKIAEKLKKFSNLFAMDDKRAQKSANQMANDDNDKKTVDDIKDNLPPDIDNNGDLF